ncbi:transporter substrate-binding domain-containing protein [Salmonella enterica]|nr:transporter substrate-binding domain-containing protein [Salmonella enterica]
MIKSLLLIGCLICLFAGKAFASDNELNLLARSHVVLDKLDLTQAEWRWLRDRQRLRVAVWQPMSPPYEITTGLNDYGGINADFLGVIAENLNLKPEITCYGSYDEAMAALFSGRADLVAQADVNQQQAGLILSLPYSENKPVEVINIDGYRSENIKSVASCPGYGPRLLQARYPGAQVKTYSSSRHALEALAFRHLDLFLCDANTAQYLINQSNLKNLVARPTAQHIEKIGFSFAAVKQAPQWIDIINKVLKTTPDTIRTEIHRRWNGGIPLSLSDKSLIYSSLEKKWIEEHREIHVAVVADNMPISWFTPAGKMRGIIVDILTALRLRTGFIFKIEAYPNYESALEAVEKGKSDVIAGAIEESIWQYNLLTTRAWLYNSWVMVGKSQLSQNQASRLVVQAAQAPSLWLKQNENQQIDVVEDWRSGLDRVKSGRNNVMIMPLLVASKWLAAPEYAGLSILGSLDTNPMRFSFGAADKYYPLVTILNKALINIPPEDMHAIIRNGVSSDELAAGVPNPFLANIKQWIGLSAFIVLMAAVGGWHYIILRRRLLAEVHRVKQAEEASRMKSAFLATMSHEIRAPVSAIGGMLELVMQRPLDAKGNQQRVQVAWQGAQSLLALIGNILDVSRIEAGKLVLHPERVSLRELIESVAVLFESQAMQKALRFYLELDSELGGDVLVDRLRFRQILSNLLSNAIKFTPSGSVTLKAIQGEREPDDVINLCLVVEDTGVGIDPVLQWRLFQPFFQADSQVGQGSGLGLYICRRLTEMMGGDITLESSPQRGTSVTVRLRLPGLAPVAVPLRTEETARSEPASQLTVLVVDDNSAGRMLLEHQLLHLGHRAACFASAVEALQYLERHPVSLVITDCNMPGMDGFVLAGRLKEHFPDLPVFGITADARDSTREQALAAGMDGCLFKPVTLARLGESIQGVAASGPSGEALVNFTLHPTLLEGDNTLAFLRLQFAELEDTLAWLPDWPAMSHDEIRLRLHRLRGGLQLLGLPEIEALCSSQERQPEAETMKALEAALRQLRISLGRITDAIESPTA